MTTNYGSDGTSIESSGYDTVADVSSSWTQPSYTRLASSGLLSGALNALQTTLNIGFSYSTETAVPSERDWRVRVSCAPYQGILYNDTVNNILMQPLQVTSGAVFPYTPQITVQHTARYGAVPLTHSNYSSFFYEGSEVQAINISGDFTVQNIAEGQYLLAVIYFFRAASKMYFGRDGQPSSTNQFGIVPAGNPPPMLFLNGYGSHYFPRVPCVLTSFQHVMPPDCDYVDVPFSPRLQKPANAPELTATSAMTTRLPTQSTITISLQPIYSRKAVHDRFTLAEFARGNLLGGGSPPTGGFI